MEQCPVCRNPITEKNYHYSEKGGYISIECSACRITVGLTDIRKIIEKGKIVDVYNLLHNLSEEARGKNKEDYPEEF